MSTVYAVASGKGGVGKTTTAVNLGAAMVEAGRSVVVADLDLGMANLGDVLNVDPPAATLHDVLAAGADLEEALVEAPGGFDALLGSGDIEAFGTADPAALPGVVEALRERYEVVILDGAAGLSHDMTVPLGLADAVLLVTTTATAGIENAAKTQALVDRLGGTIEGAIVTRLGSAGQGTPEGVENRLDVPVLGAVPEDGAIALSAEEGRPLVTVDRQSPAAQSYREIAYGLLDEPLPRDWAEEDAADQPGRMGPGAQTGAAGSEAEDSAGPADEETGGEEMGEHPDEGLADTLETMEEGPDPEADPSQEGEATDEAAENEGKGVFSRLFGGLFG